MELKWIVFLMVLAVLPALATAAQVDGNFTKINLVGGRLSSANYITWLSFGQEFAGETSSASFNTHIGFYYPIAPDPDVNITAIDGNADNVAMPFFSYSADGNLTIDFNVVDFENRRLRATIRYSTNPTPDSGTIIVSDLNLNQQVCPSQNWDTNVAKCFWDWNIFGVADANYYVTVQIENSYGSLDFNATDNNFSVNFVSIFLISIVPDTNRNTFDSTPTFTATYSATLSECGFRAYFNGNLVAEGAGTVSGAACDYTHSPSLLVGETVFVDFNASASGTTTDYNRSGKLAYAGMPSNTLFLNSDSLSMIAIALSSMAIALMIIVLISNRRRKA